MQPTVPAQPEADAEALRAELSATFGHDQFREGQLEAIRAVLNGRDVVAVMPTGGGKSLLYQLPALRLPGVTLVVSPLIALMKDQVDQLIERDVPATFVNSSLGLGEQRERLRRASSGELKLLYIAPERFRNPRFRAALESIEVSLLAIDEAHCISQWGHDFRPDYRRLGAARQMFGKTPVIALTATATPEVRGDIVVELNLDDPLTLVTGFDRKNLFIEVVHTRGDGHKLAEIETTIDEAGGSGIVYVASRKSAERVASWLEERQRSVGIYHAGLDERARNRIQERFMADEVQVMVATNAFGMGIDKADIRFVVHYEFPRSLEAYYQEIGRAGRDGEPAIAKLLFTFADKRIQEFFIDGANPSLELIHGVYGAILAASDHGESETARSIAATLGQRNDMAVSSAVVLLERAGVVARRAPLPGERGRPIQLRERHALADLPVDGTLLKRKVDADRAKLDAVIKLAYHGGCRKERLLAYFGDTRRDRTCGACDQCVRRVETERALDDTERTTALAALTTVRAVDGRLGLVRLAELLVGEGWETAARFGLEGTDAHGALAHLDKRTVRDWLDALLDAALLRKEDLRSGKGYVIKTTSSGKRALDGRDELHLAPPVPMPPPPPRRRRRSPAPARTRTAAPASAAEATLFPPVEEPKTAAADPALLTELKRWRREEARRRAVPAYVVFHDAVLEEIAATQPADDRALLAISGVGPRKLEEYGSDVLDMVRRQR